MEFGDRIKELRLECKLSQQELASAIKISKSSISMYENNNRLPEIETFEALADFFNVDMDYLKGKSDIKRKNPYEGLGKALLNPDKDDESILEMFRDIKSMSLEQRDKLKPIIKLIKSNLL
jgi:transcriptional regulator with XRE-family HTH domain